ncbi:serine/threonine-protein kinase SBK1-like [Branchiostoma floridae]|uniref:Serine/threonine-protein kinase SBK1-like n=1 Tax=Branchiostoma floridae TaxID=7739 RepID=A0A9J7N9A3_BRAFL|nr:serine/threonine-protein kinase SBK1-like [Branchiostoma floridae]
MSQNANKNTNASSSSGFELPKVDVHSHYLIVREVGRGTYGRVDLAIHKETGTKLALKSVPKRTTRLRDFYREFTLSQYLSAHPFIITTYDVAFQTKHYFIFGQEYSAVGDLFEAIPPQEGLPEETAKLCVQQIGSALEFMHAKGLVHRDVKPENILLFDRDCRRVKLMDFGMTRKCGTHVKKISGTIPYTPPEICQAAHNDGFYVETSADVWAFGVLIFCMLTGNFPWENAEDRDCYFTEFVGWQKRTTSGMPSQWKKFTPRLMKFFRKSLEIKPEKRCQIREVYKYVHYDWLLPPLNGNRWVPMTSPTETGSTSTAITDDVVQPCAVEVLL